MLVLLHKQRAVKFKFKQWEAEMETVQLKLLLRYEASQTRPQQ